MTILWENNWLSFGWDWQLALGVKFVGGFKWPWLVEVRVLCFEIWWMPGCEGVPVALEDEKEG